MPRVIAFLPAAALAFCAFFQSHLLSEEKQVGPSDVSSSFSLYGTTPENPSGNLLCYVAYKKGVPAENVRKEGELWVCSTKLSNHRKITDVSFSHHNGAEQSWIDDNRIVVRDYEKSLNTSKLRVVDVRTGLDVQTPIIGATTLGHSPRENSVLFNVTSKDGVHGNRQPGIYEWNVDTGNTRPVFMQSDKASEVLSQAPASSLTEGTLPPKEWQCLHSQYSPDGKKIFFRLDIAKQDEAWLVAVCDRDGKNLVVMQSEPKRLLHTLWYDSQTLVGHDRGNNHWTKPGALKLWKIGDRDGTPIGIPGNHLAMSPDGKHFASETGYHSKPVVLRYFSYGTLDVEQAKIIAESPFSEAIWKKSFHMNPSFSRDGKRLYYNKPLSNETNGTFCYDLN